MKTIESAERVATWIGRIKWVFIATALLWGVLAAIGIETQTTLPRAYEVTSILVGVIFAGLTWVVLGWLQYTLAVEIVTARNTASTEITTLSMEHV